MRPFGTWSPPGTLAAGFAAGVVELVALALALGHVAWRVGPPLVHSICSPAWIARPQAEQRLG